MRRTLTLNHSNLPPYASPAQQENTFGNNETESLKVTCQNLRNHVHVLCKLPQKHGEGGRLLNNNILCHLLYVICWQRDAASPERRREREREKKKNISRTVLKFK